MEILLKVKILKALNKTKNINETGPTDESES